MVSLNIFRDDCADGKTKSLRLGSQDVFCVPLPQDSNSDYSYNPPYSFNYSLSPNLPYPPGVQYLSLHRYLTFPFYSSKRPGLHSERPSLHNIAAFPLTVIFNENRTLWNWPLGPVDRISGTWRILASGEKDECHS